MFKNRDGVVVHSVHSVANGPEHCLQELSHKAHVDGVPVVRYSPSAQPAEQVPLVPRVIPVAHPVQSEAVGPSQVRQLASHDAQTGGEVVATYSLVLQELKH